MSDLETRAMEAAKVKWQNACCVYCGSTPMATADEPEWDEAAHSITCPSVVILELLAAWKEAEAKNAELEKKLEALRHCPHGESGLCGDLRADEDNACAYCYSLAKNQRDGALAEVERLKAELAGEKARQLETLPFWAKQLESDLAEARRVVGELIPMVEDRAHVSVLAAARKLVGESKGESMSYPGTPMYQDLHEISRINLKRCERWHGLHDWTPAEWACAMAGEAGEVCNAVKKLIRLDKDIQQKSGPQTRDEAIAAIKNEIGDTFLYLDLLAQRLGIDMAEAIRDTFNRVSVREGFPERIKDYL